MDNTSVGLGLEMLRRCHGLSAKQLSRNAGYPDYLVSRIETGKRTLLCQEAYQITAAMGETLDSLAKAILIVEASPLYEQVRSLRAQQEQVIHDIKALKT